MVRPEVRTETAAARLEKGQASRAWPLPHFRFPAQPAPAMVRVPGPGPGTPPYPCLAPVLPQRCRSGGDMTLQRRGPGPRDAGGLGAR